MSYIRQQQFKKPKALYEQICLGDAFFSFFSYVRKKAIVLNMVELHKYGACVCLNVSVLPLLVSLLVQAVWWPGKCKSYF